MTTKLTALILLFGIPFAYAQDLTPFQNDEGKYGFSDSTKKIIVQPKYGNVVPFNEGFAVVSLNSKYGYVDKTGKEVVQIKYDFAGSFFGGIAVVQLNGKYDIINKSIKEINSVKYDGAQAIGEGLAGVFLNTKSRWGVINKKGIEIIPMKYESILYFNEGLLGVQLKDKWGFVNKSGDVVIPIKYDKVNSFDNGLATVNLNGKWGLVNKTGKELTSFKYNWIECDWDKDFLFYEGLAKVNVGSIGSICLRNSNISLPDGGKFGFIDKTGKEITPIKYDWIDAFSEGLAVVNIGGTSWEYQTIDGTQSVKGKSGGKHGYIDKTGKEIISIKYEAASNFVDGIAMVKLNGKWGFIDKTDKEVFPFIFDEVSETVISRNGMYISKMILDSKMNVIKDGKIKVRVGSRWFYIEEAKIK